MARLGRQISQTLIAERLKLSVPTVSRALRNEPGIHPQTRIRVMEAAAELRYQPLRTRTPNKPTEQKNVGVFIRSLSGSLRPRFLDGMSKLAASMNVSLVLHHSPSHDAQSLLDVSTQPVALRQGTLDGVILMHGWPTAVAQYLADRMPCVSIVHRMPTIKNADVVEMDHEQGISLLMRHLYELGHRRIGFVGSNIDVSWAWARYGGYMLALNDLGLEATPSHVLALPAQLLEDRTASWEGWAEKLTAMVDDGVTALVASSHWVGCTVCKIFEEKGISVPEEVSVTGFDNSLGAVGVDLTSIRVPAEEMGAEALRQVLLRTAEPNRPQRAVRFSCELVRGATTAAPPLSEPTNGHAPTGDGHRRPRDGTQLDGAQSDGARLDGAQLDGASPAHDKKPKRNGVKST
jgi:LacI family transcriptional regulator